MKKSTKVTIAVLVVASIAAYIMFREPPVTEIPYDNFVKIVKDQRVASVTISGPIISLLDAQGQEFTTINPGDRHLIDDLLENNVQITAQLPSVWSSILWGFGPILLLVGVWIWFMRKRSGGAPVKPLDMSQSVSDTKFDDVAGIDDCLADVREVTQYLIDPKKFAKMGGTMPKGILLSGPPGTGKTLLARAIAGEAGVPFFSLSGSDFVEMFVGVGASRVRALFESAKKIEGGKCVIFIDEIDAVGKARNNSGTGGNDERDQTLNSLLVQMDGFDKNSGLLVVAATNRADMLDKALTRPGRFDRQIDVTMPDLLSREKILKVHVKNILTDKSLSLRDIARTTAGFSGADLANLCNEAALLAAREDKEYVDNDAFDRSFDKIIMGTVRDVNPMNRAEQEATAYHESGHAIVGHFSHKHDPVHKVSIMPRGRALGVTVYLPERDSFGTSRAQLEGRLSTLYGGRCAEELLYGEMGTSTGASNDMERATEICTLMVTQWGFNDSIGKLVINQKNEYGMSNSGGTTQMKNSDKEIRALSDRTYANAMKILVDNRTTLENMTKALIEYETIDKDQVKRIMDGEDISPSIVLNQNS
jgi:cell division protease FtsH